MTTQTKHFIEPLDVLFLRGNKLFGDPGSYGESLVPPWPSVAAGALRSLILANDGYDLAAFAAGGAVHPQLGTPQTPGSFAIVGIEVARRGPTGNVDTFHALPADLVATRVETAGLLQLQQLRPLPPSPGILSSLPLAHWPVLAQAQRSKAVNGLWLTSAGWAAYLSGDLPTLGQMIATDELWKLDPRVGVGLDSESGRAADGQLFSVQAVAFRAGVGFLATVRGASVPASGMLRFGGDGRGAALHAADHHAPEIDLAVLASKKRCRLVLTTPGLFKDGWCPPGVDETLQLRLPGLSARLVCAAVPRAEVVSGWDLAQRQPKPAMRAAPAGSVYWLDQLETTPSALRKLAESGLWTDESDNLQRRAEGFNRFSFAAW
jgi:CRISPR-associated protein Cmr3